MEAGMRARAGAGRAVAVAATVVMAACSPNPTQSPSATATVAPSVGAATLLPSGSLPPSFETPVPVASMGAWVVRPVPEYTTSGGADLATSVDGKTQFIHVVVSNLEEGMEGGFDASVYFRTGNAGLGWDDRLLIGGMSPRIASAGPNVYVAFEAYGCRGGSGVLRNSDHGRRAAWAPLSCVTRNPVRGSEGAPAVAATGSLVYVASVDDVTGRVAVGISRDRGRTWRRVDLGPVRPDESGIVGPVQVAATGRFAAVAWSDRGGTFTRVSVDAGVHWGPSSSLPGGVASSSARGSRLAFGGAADDGSTAVFIWAQRDGWGEIAVPAIPPASPLEPRSATVALGPGTSVAVTHAVCRSTQAGLEGDTWWATSPDGGVTWRPLEPLPVCAGTGPIAWGADGRAFLLVPGEEEGYALAVHP
jgi:hypothetical protein